MAGKKKSGGRKKSETLVLLDAHAILHRAYHALPDFSSSKGEPTGALFGLVSMLLKITQELKPDYLVACRDMPGPTVRHEKYEAYKATRAKTEDALVAQLTRAPVVFEAFGIPLYEKAGYEADDLLGTIVRQVASRSGLKTIIASGDMDALQLVSPRVSVYTLRKGLSDTVRYDEKAVEARYGFPPERVVDFKALSGDPSDNIPGVRGIGEKTATALVGHFGPVEKMYEVLERSPERFEKAGFKARAIELLRSGRETAFLSKELATIHTDVAISFELPEHWRLGNHAESIADLCDLLEFRALKARVRQLAGVPSEAPEKPTEVDPESLKEVSIALWLLRSDLTNPALDDVLRFAKTETFDDAKKKIFEELEATGRLSEVYDRIEKPLIPVVERMNKTGVYLDVPRLKALSREYGASLGEVAARIYKAAGHEFNIASPRQLAMVLYDELALGGARKKTPTGARTTREEELAKLAPEHKVIADVLAFRELQKLLSTYIEKLPTLADEASRLHAEFLQAGTTTGRMASQNPNLQNIPVKSEHGRRIRAAFAAPSGRLLVAIDYSQIELRLAAGLSGDPRLIEVFRQGGDVHRAVASEVFGVAPEKVDYEMRRKAKVINFGILYGMGVNALRANLGEGVSRREAAGFLERYFENFSGLARYIDAQKASAAKLGYTETLFGRRRYFSGFASPLPSVVAQAERMAVNAPLQGTQADIIKLAMVEADRLIEEKGWRSKAALVLQVHDELVYEVDAERAEEIARAVCEVMEQVAPARKLCDVPIVAEVSIGKDWDSCEKIARV